MSKSELEQQFYLACRAESLPEPEREYRFHGTRRFAFDFAWPEQRVAVEIEGGIWSGGRHVRGQGYSDDCEKYNLATVEGWRVFRFTGGMVERDPCGCAMMVKESLR